MKRILLLLLFLSGTAYAGNEGHLDVYPAPDGAAMNEDFKVEVRLPGGQWQTVETYLVQVDEVRGTTHHFEDASMAYFDFEGQVEVRVTHVLADIASARVRPISYGIETKVAGKSMTFTLDRPCNLSIEVDGDIFHNLHLFANPVDPNRPENLSDPNLIYFGPGIHRIEGRRNELRIESGKTVYVAGGAVVLGTLHVARAKSVKILGRGIVRPERNAPGVQISNSSDVYVDGIITTQLPTGGSDGVTIRNVKSISHYGWGDGMNVFASSNVLFDGVFCRNSDDCTTVYATRKGYSGSSRNIVMQNSTLWADVAHPIFIGIHGNAEEPDTIENCIYRNIDILDHKEKQLNYQGCLAINGGDNNVIRNITFENIRIEDFREGQLVNIRIFFNEKYCKAPGQCIENVLFKDVSYDGENANISVISGYDANRKVRNVRFENLRINGRVISDDMPGKPAWYATGDMAHIYIGEHVENVTFSR
jgi:hypothetical protein